MALILDNPLFSIDPLLLIRIPSFLDMLSATRSACFSLKLCRYNPWSNPIPISPLTTLSTLHPLQFSDLALFHVLCPFVDFHILYLSESVHSVIVIFSFQNLSDELLVQCTISRDDVSAPSENAVIPVYSELVYRFRIAINMITPCRSRQRTMCSEPVKSISVSPIYLHLPVLSISLFVRD